MKTQQYNCPSYYDDEVKGIVDCTCGKCTIKPMKTYTQKQYDSAKKRAYNNGNDTMKEEHKVKLVEVVRVALEKDDYYMIGRIGRLLVSMMETEDKLQTIIRDDEEEEDIELF